MIKGGDASCVSPETPTGPSSAAPTFNPKGCGTAILSVVFQKAQADYGPYNYKKNIWPEKGPPIPVNLYIGSGGHMTDDLQKAQIFGFSKKAKERLKAYKDPRLFEVRAIRIVEV